MKKRALNITIPNGSNIGSKTLKLDEGQVVNLALYHQNNPSSSLNVKLEDDRGDDIITLIPYQEFKPTNGDYLKSRMPVSFKGGREVTVKAKSSTNLTAEFSFDLVFDIDQSITPE